MTNREHKDYYSNCLFEAIKAKIKWGKQVRIIYKLLTGENPLALADGMKPDGLLVVATPKWRSVP